MFFPSKCALCDEIIDRGAVFCTSCFPEIPWIVGKTCEKCGIEVNINYPSPICARCREAKFPFERNISLMMHEKAGKRAVLNAKFYKKASIRELTYLLTNKILEENIKVDMVTFIPMTVKQEKEKGYHLTLLMAKTIAEIMNVPCGEALEKIKDTLSQKGLTKKQRIINLRGAFIAKEYVKGKNVLIVDDVFTTGSTMKEATKALKKRGAKNVYTATLSIKDRK